MIADRGLRSADWKTVRLGDVAAVERYSIQPEAIKTGTIYVGLEHIETGGRFLDPKPVDEGELESSKFQFTAEHLLYGKLRPYLAKIACPEFSGICSTDIVPIRPSRSVERRYLYHFLRQPVMIDFANSRAVGVNLPRLSPSTLEEFEVPLPPLAEQRRIAEVLDVPEVVNLVFFKLVRSKTKFWQMIGRGTRLCPNLFGPGEDKEFFQVFDFCQNLEFFSQNPETVEGSLGESLSKRLFKARLELIAALEDHPATNTGEKAGQVAEDPERAADLRASTKDLLHTEVAAMNVHNFIVRPHRRLVEAYAESRAWDRLTPEGRRELAEHAAGLPTELEREEEEAKRFDLLILHLQLAVLRAEPSFERLRDQVMNLAGLLKEKASIPAVKTQLVLIQELQVSEWWQNVTPAMLETVRRKLRDLVKLIDKVARKPLYTDFDDEMGPETTVAIPGFAAPDGFERFRAKARQFLLQHENHLAIQKVRLNEPLTAGDLAEIERMLLESGIGSPEQIAQAKAKAAGFGLFIRCLVGLQRDAAKRSLGSFLARSSLSANQIEFLNLIVEHLTRHGAMSPALLYEPPFTDRAPHGPEALFPAADVEQLVAAIDETNSRAAG